MADGRERAGVCRRLLRKIDVRDIDAVLKAVQQWKSEASKVGHSVSHVVLGYEAGRDGFWLARALREHGIEVYVIHPASIAVERRGRRAKTDRIDVDMLLGTCSALRGEPQRRTMAPIPQSTKRRIFLLPSTRRRIFALTTDPPYESDQVRA